MSPTGNINVNPTGTFQIISGNVCRVWNTGDTAYSQLHSDYLMLIDGVTAPGTATGKALIYVDTADGDLKVKFGDGTVKTIATDT